MIKMCVILIAKACMGQYFVCLRALYKHDYKIDTCIDYVLSMSMSIDEGVSKSS